jgi:hypothetical protein
MMTQSTERLASPAAWRGTRPNALLCCCSCTTSYCHVIVRDLLGHLNLTISTCDTCGTPYMSRTRSHFAALRQRQNEKAETLRCCRRPALSDPASRSEQLLYFICARPSLCPRLLPWPKRGSQRYHLRALGSFGCEGRVDEDTSLTGTAAACVTLSVSQPARVISPT